MDAATGPFPPELRTIPLIEAGNGGPVALAEAAPERLRDVLTLGRRHYGRVALRLGDWAGRRWLAKSDNPYGGEIAAVAARGGRPGAFLLNLSYEWTCTTGVGPDPSGNGARMLRTLDWPLDGLGANLVVARHEGDMGPFYNVTWPGLVGVVTAMAPGRFSVALNQTPMRRYSPWCWLDWSIARGRWWRSRAIPPIHLLRRVCDTCRTYADAKAALVETALCLPAFFTLSGITPDQGCVIERLEDRAAVREAPTSVANHWMAFDVLDRPRGEDSVGRWQMMEQVRQRAAADFSWLVPPILNETTRVAVIANAAQGFLMVQGFEADGPATAVFTL
ncbi:MAG: hypothetical protein IIC54_12955 [Proteobacteria bacterium]|nr:hypothetical protein [Pseudomonadota bacterium]MCH8214965.1 hypothetical protein [Pseudomonadota bacterium]